MNLRDQIARAIAMGEPSVHWTKFRDHAENVLAVFQNTLDNITDIEELSELQCKIAAMLETSE